MFGVPTFSKTLLLLIVFKESHNFNLEDRDPLVKKAPDDQQGSYFGFSVAQHGTGATSNHNNTYWILVGAPLGRNLQPATNHSGALFKCPISRNDNDCEQVETDGKQTTDFDYNIDNGNTEQIDESQLKPPDSNEIKNGQWLGVTVRSQKLGGIVLVCAHRYIMSENLNRFHYGQGLCYLLDKDLNTYNSLLLCKGRRMEKLHQQFGFCQVGTSASFVGEDFALMGSPGPYTWRGTIFAQMVTGDWLKQDKTIYHGPFGDIDLIEKYSYLGMSVGGGHFFDKKQYTYVAGAPRSKMVGQVYFFKKYKTNEELNTSLILTGEQFAGSFGYELLATDVNSDGYDDLFVAAPFYYEEFKGGAVYIYYNLKDCKSDNCRWDKVLHGKPQSRFGFSMTSLGDINKDGYNDIAIGAPYEDEQGAIYIYLGSGNGISDEPSQVIRKKQVKTLGYSLSGGLDMDDNGYPDLLAGAFESDKVLLFKTRPIIDIKIVVRGDELKNINATKKGCSSAPNNNYTCFSFSTCFSVVGRTQRSHRFNVIYKIAEEKKIVNRVWFVDPEHPDKKSTFNTKMVPVDRYSHEYCQVETVNIKDGISDILSPIKFRVNYTLENNTFHAPILNKTSVKIITASFQKECGADDECESYLTLEAGADLKLDESGAYKIEMIDEPIVLEANVTNTGESAYEAKLFVAHPTSLSYVGIKSENKNVTDALKCSYANQTLVVCEIGNPLRKNGRVNVGLRFEISKKADVQRIVLRTFVNSTSTELSERTGQDVVAVLKKIAKFQVRGKASSNLFYGGRVIGESAIKHINEVGARVVHKYYIDNNGQWDLVNLKVSIKWPLQVSPGPDHPDKQGKWLLYLDSEPKLYGSNIEGYCSLLGDVKPNELSLNTSKGYDEPENLMMPDGFDANEGDFNASTGHFRAKRSATYVVPYETTERAGKKRKIAIMDCDAGTAKCIGISCTIRRLGKGHQAEIDVTSRIWNSTLVEDYSNVDWVVIRSKAFVELEDLSYNISVDTMPQFSDETIAYPEIVSADTEINWYIIGIAVVVGLILLIFIVVILYKCGFFKRKRVSKDPTLSGNLQKKDEADHLLKE
ncbi:unnamed protein product [Phyllotreta striolata]|uniref:Integrin alpha-PS1 n=1 Tax=Phyllotreta striolata TaxID=444603 RepID=A0A9N9XRV3_PHYSR|nr:unnamed protein product [Phyllotreta striolata]